MRIFFIRTIYIGLLALLNVKLVYVYPSIWSIESVILYYLAALLVAIVYAVAMFFMIHMTYELVIRQFCQDYDIYIDTN